MVLPLVTIEGKATGDPELRYAQSGMAWGKFTVAANSRKKNEQTGQWEDDKTLFMPVTCFREMAEHVAESVEKGDLVTVVGRIHTDEWQDKDSGEKRSRVVMIADSVAVSLQFRNIPHGAGRSQRTSEPTPASDDPWATPPPARPAPAPTPAPEYREPPF